MKRELVHIYDKKKEKNSFVSLFNFNWPTFVSIQPCAPVTSITCPQRPVVAISLPYFSTPKFQEILQPQTFSTFSRISRQFVSLSSDTNRIPLESLSNPILSRVTSRKKAIVVHPDS